MKNLSDCRILIVDDTKFNIKILEDTLKSDYQISVAMNGKAALKFMEEVVPDIILLDIMMPEMDGIAALKAIKGNDPSAVVIMCSAMGQQAMVIDAIQAGAKDFIVKPFQPNRVLEAVQKVVES